MSHKHPPEGSVNQDMGRKCARRFSTVAFRLKHNRASGKEVIGEMSVEWMTDAGSPLKNFSGEKKGRKLSVVGRGGLAKMWRGSINYLRTR